MKESALYADTQDTSQLNTQMCHDTSQLTKDTLQLNLVEEARTARLRHCALHEATSGARSAVGEPLRAPILAPRLGEAVGSVDRAGALLRLLGQGTEDVPLRQALRVVELLLLLLRELRLLQRSSGSRGNAVREERRVHLATLPRSEGAVRLRPLLVLLRCRVRRKEDMVSTSTVARVAVEVVTVKAVEVRVAAATEEVVTAEEGSAVAARVAVERVVVEMARARLLGRRLLGAHRHSRGPHGHAGLHARRQEGAGRRRGKDNEEGAEHDRRCTGERSLQSFRVCSLG